jgi:hypothetical protein
LRYRVGQKDIPTTTQKYCWRPDPGMIHGVREGSALLHTSNQC